MATWDDVRRLALSLPETSERLSRGNAQWRVKDKLFVWERPLRNTDLAALGETQGRRPGPVARRLAGGARILFIDPGGTKRARHRRSP